MAEAEVCAEVCPEGATDGAAEEAAVAGRGGGAERRSISSGTEKLPFTASNSWA